jgi:hypothetical protein
MKKDKKYPALMISASKKDLLVIKELREKYHINISAFFREQVEKLYKILSKNESPKII